VKGQVNMKNLANSINTEYHWAQNMKIDFAVHKGHVNMQNHANV
jgi:hypothetical protein